jgi:hypothetical protein
MTTLWVPEFPSWGVKRPKRETHSPQRSVDVKIAWSYTTTPTYVFMAPCLIKHKNDFVFNNNNNYNKKTNITV